MSRCLFDGIHSLRREEREEDRVLACALVPIVLNANQASELLRAKMGIRVFGLGNGPTRLVLVAEDEARNCCERVATRPRWSTPPRPRSLQRHRRRIPDTTGETRRALLRARWRSHARARRVPPQTDRLTRTPEPECTKPRRWRGFARAHVRAWVSHSRAWPQKSPTRQPSRRRR